MVLVCRWLVECAALKTLVGKFDVVAIVIAGSRDSRSPDYKAHVIGGSVRFIQVDRGRFARHTRNLYSPHWDLLSVRLTLSQHAADARPQCLEQMVSIAEKLAMNFEFLRIDYCCIDSKLYIGELTNYPGAGFERFIPNQFSEELGSYWPTVEN